MRRYKEEMDIAELPDLAKLNVEVAKRIREKDLPLLVIEQGRIMPLQARPIKPTWIPRRGFPITPLSCRLYSRLSKRRNKIWSSLEICCQAIGYLSE